MRKSSFLVLALCVVPILAAPSHAQQSRSDTLFTVEKYLDFEQVNDPQISPDGTQIVYTRRYVNKLEDRWDASLWIMNADGTRNRFLTKGGSPRWSPDGARIAFLGDGEPSGTQLFVRYMDAEGATSQVTHVSEPIGDIRWSPDGRWIGFSMFVPKQNSWQIDMPVAPAGAKWTPAPKYITTLHYRQDRRGFNRPGYTHLFVVPADGGTARALTSGDWSVGAQFDGQQGGVSWDWSVDGRTVYVVGMNDPKADMNYRNSNIYSVDVATGALKRVTAQDGAWDGVAVSPDGRRIAYDGFPNSKASYQASEVYVANADGSAPQKLTTLDRDPGGIQWARDGSGVYFTVFETGTANVYYAPATGAGATKLTSGAQLVSLTSLARTGVGAGTRSTFSDPADVVRIDVTRRGAAATIAQLTRVNDDVLSNVKLATIERITAKSTNNTEVEGWIVRPPSFNPSKKYPMIFEIHGGPHGMYNVGFSASYQNFAANGFVVVYSNPRGSTGYGSAFGNAIEKNYPGPDYDDLMAIVDAAVAKGYVDTDRMYVGGCSGGGVLSSWVIGHTDRFAAAAVRCPVTDWISMTGMTDIPLFTFQFFDKPYWEDPKSWLEHSTLMHVGNVKTPTLLMTGELDMRTPIPQTEEFYVALKMRGVPAALLRFEGENHGTSSRPSNWMRTQLYMMSWYNQWPARATMAGEPVSRP
ncbi:MAG TPA: S9 family peptidase [Gemmatimonadaceae bacterium]|nr:S9 family peptidase [Gemmatimonadaceae bacterium]